jgi:hypothetical protein
VEEYVVPDVNGVKDGKERRDVAAFKISVKEKRENKVKKRAADECYRGGD